MNIKFVIIIFFISIITLTNAWFDDYEDKWWKGKFKEVKIIKKVKVAKGPGLKFKAKCWYDEMKAKYGKGCGCGCRRRRR